MEKEKTPVVIAFVCVDWRMHHPDSNFAKNLYEFLNAEKIYFITYPGPDKLGSKDFDSKKRNSFAEGCFNETRMVLKAHGASNVPKVIVGHTSCAGHQVDEKCHCEDCKETAYLLNLKLGLEKPIQPLIAVKQNEDDFDWKIQPIE